MRDNRVSEVLLHFIWRYRYYNHRELTTDAGAPLHIHYPGELNTDQGPDFKNARLTIGERILEGPVELHVRASDFLHHGHTGDPTTKTSSFTSSGSTIPLTRRIASPFSNYNA